MKNIAQLRCTAISPKLNFKWKKDENSVWICSIFWKMWVNFQVKVKFVNVFFFFFMSVSNLRWPTYGMLWYGIGKLRLLDRQVDNISMGNPLMRGPPPPPPEGAPLTFMKKNHNCKRNDNDVNLYKFVISLHANPWHAPLYRISICALENKINSNILMWSNTWNSCAPAGLPMHRRRTIGRTRSQLQAL